MIEDQQRYRDALAQYLVSEKDQRPYWETDHRSVSMPLIKSGYNDSVRYGVPGILGGSAWGTLDDILRGRMVEKGEIMQGASDAAGAAMIGGFSMSRPANSLGVFGGAMPEGYRSRNVGGAIGDNTNYQIEKVGWFGRGKPVGNAYVRDLGDKAQVGRIVIDTEHQGKGIGTSLYGQIESDLGKPLVPDSSLTDAAYNFWLKHRPEAVDGKYVKPDGINSWMPVETAKTYYGDGVKKNTGALSSSLQDQLANLDALIASDIISPSSPSGSIGSGGLRAAEDPSTTIKVRSLPWSQEYTATKGKGYIEASRPIDGTDLRVYASSNGGETGTGLSMYRALIDEANRKGLSFTSDKTVSPSAQHIYDALRRRGHRVDVNPDTRTTVDGVLKSDVAPIFDVGPSPWATYANAPTSAASPLINYLLQYDERNR